MKFGAHHYLFTNKWDDNALSLFDTYRELGLECLEIAVGDDMVFNEEETRKRAEGNSIDIVISPGGIWPEEYDISTDDPGPEEKAAIEWHKSQIERGSRIGAVAYTGALYGHPGTVRRRRPPEDEFNRTAEGLYQIAEHAAAQSITIALEPMSHFRTHIVNNSRQLMELIALADHDNLYALFDTYHMMTEELDFCAALRLLGERLWGLHACGSNRGIPGKGIAPWDDVFKALADIRFDGYVTMESYNSSIGDFAYERMMFHDVCPDGKEFVKEGLTFLKAGLSGKVKER